MAIPVPARTALEWAEERNRELGHENLGFLSEQRGTVPIEPPRHVLPPSHRPWDDIAGELPELFRTMRVRSAFDAMPVLPADRSNLPAEDLLRASTLLSMFAHSYQRIAQTPADDLPPAIARPWQQVSDRLQRFTPHLSYIDIVVHNWRLRDPSCADPMRVENLDLLVPTVGNEEERIFYLVQLEILAQTAPIVGCTVRAHEAVAADDTDALKRELIGITDTLRRAGRESFPKIQPHPYGSSHVDNVTWAKCVAPFAVPFFEGVPGTSGTNAMLFHILDTFLGRASYDSRFGAEVMHLRDWFPVHWRSFLAALGKISVKRYVETRRDRELEGLFKEMVQAYIGEQGFLPRHRLKVHGYLDIAFKVGRDVTITGFKGMFKDRAWEQVDEELRSAVEERRLSAPAAISHAPISSVADVVGQEDGSVKRVALDVLGGGIRFQPGDRVAVLPENDRDLVRRTLEALRARGDEPIQLTSAWREALAAREGLAGAEELPLREVLALGRIRPVQREVAKVLLAASRDETLEAIVEARAEDQWELWDLLEMLSSHAFDNRTLWRAHPGEGEHICRVVPPEIARMYSISSAMDGSELGARQLHMTVGRLTYMTTETAVSAAAERHGTASSYLGDNEGQRVPFMVIRPPGFSLPEDGREPIVMFAGGTGIAPFRGFIQERARRGDQGESHLFLATRTTSELYFRDELELAATSGHLHLRVACSRERATARVVNEGGAARIVIEPGEPRRIDDEVLAPDNAALLWDLLRPRDDGGRGARFYVCGRAGFARSVLDALRELARRAGLSEEEVRRLLGRAASERRLMLDVFTTYAGPHTSQTTRLDASEIVLRNNDSTGWWMVLDGRVYDTTEFMHMHPGGIKLLKGYGGVDATRAYRAVMHHVQPEVDAMLGMYEIGAVRRLTFGREWGIAIGPDGLSQVMLSDLYRVWMRFLYSVVEMQNAVELDYSIYDRPLTCVDTAGEITPFHLRFLLEAHNRFLVSYLDFSTGEDLEELWRLTSGLCSRPGRSEPSSRIRDHVAAANASANAAALARATPRGLPTLIDHDPPIDALTRWAQALEAEDKSYLAELKEILRRGIEVFERFERDAVRRGGDQLLSALQEIPTLLEAYHERLAPHARTLETALA